MNEPILADSIRRVDNPNFYRPSAVITMKDKIRPEHRDAIRRSFEGYSGDPIVILDGAEQLIYTYPEIERQLSVLSVVIVLTGIMISLAIVSLGFVK